MLRALLTAALALAALIAGVFPNDASAGGWRGRPYRDGGAVLYPGWGCYSFPWGYVIPTAPYAYPVVYNSLRRYPVPRPWGVGWREAWVC
jgi:hypothetical protein